MNIQQEMMVVALKRRVQLMVWQTRLIRRDPGCDQTNQAKRLNSPNPFGLSQGTTTG